MESSNSYQLFGNTTVGLSLSVNYRVDNYFRLGFLYQPCFLSTNYLPALNYQHFISFNLSWKLSIWKLSIWNGKRGAL